MMFALNFAAVCFGSKFSVSNFLIHIKSQWKKYLPRERVKIFVAFLRQITNFRYAEISAGARGGRTNLANEVSQKLAPNLAVFGARFLLPVIKK